MQRLSRKAAIGAFLLVISIGLYVTSLSLEVARVDRTSTVFGIAQTQSDPYSLLKTIRDLYRDGHVGLAAIITCFTLIFPIGKYLALSYVYFGRSPRWRHRWLLAVKNLGQWSMGDVFVVALMVVIIRINGNVAQIHVVPLTGLWVFASSVLLSMVASALMGYDRSQSPA